MKCALILYAAPNEYIHTKHQQKGAGPQAQSRVWKKGAKLVIGNLRTHQNLQVHNQSLDCCVQMGIQLSVMKQQSPAHTHTHMPTPTVFLKCELKMKIFFLRPCLRRECKELLYSCEKQNVNI